MSLLLQRAASSVKVLAARTAASSTASAAVCASSALASSSSSSSTIASTLFAGSAGMQKQQKRFFNIHEYQSVSLFHQYGIPTPRSRTVSTPAEAEAAAEQLGGSDFVVKAQVLAGGRGKGKFTSGFQGGVHTCISSLEARSLAAKMLNQNLITKQTGPEGKLCHKVMICERLYLRREAYFAILMDRQTAGPVMVASPAGGMDIEKVADETPKLIFRESIDITKGILPGQTERLAKAMGFGSEKAAKEADTIIRQLYKLFLEKDATLVEVNPISETHDGRILCVDAKLNFDDNALYRQSDLVAFRDYTQEDPREVSADKAGLNYIGLDGNIGCLVNGAGLAMATMDAIKLTGGTPANFLDMGGGASKDQVIAALQLLNADQQTKAILVNIFGGIMRCDTIALGLIAAAQTLNLKKPIVIRLAGTNVAEAIKLIDDSGLRMLTAADLQEAATKAVRVVQIIDMANEAHLDVNFQLPL